MSPDPGQDYGFRLRHRFRWLKISVRELAAKAGVAPATTRKILAGRTDVRFANLLDVAKALGFEPVLFFTDPGAAPYVPRPKTMEGHK